VNKGMSHRHGRGQGAVHNGLVDLQRGAAIVALQIVLRAIASKVNNSLSVRRGLAHALHWYKSLSSHRLYSRKCANPALVLHKTITT
jgi:hypothetical protein